MLVAGTSAALAVTTSDNASKAPVSTAGPAPAPAKAGSGAPGKAEADKREAAKPPTAPPAKK